MGNSLSFTSNSNPIRVMVVDDSAVVRGLVTKILEEDDLVDVVVSASNGEAAIKFLSRHDIEVIVLDIEMPVMDGLTAIPLLLKEKPNVQIIMASTLTLKNASISFKAMSLGAADYVPKPTTSRDIYGGDSFKREIRDKVRALGNAYRKGHPAVNKTSEKPKEKEGVAKKSHWNGDYTLLPEMKIKPEVLAIGSSTGGPQALFSLFAKVKNSISQPIFITQHMPMTFTKILAEHIERVSGVKTAEAEDGEIVTKNRIYVAPGGLHMIINQEGMNRVIKLVDSPPENFCKPAVDPMLRSIADAYGNKVLVTILTGMGSDGQKGGQVIVDAGGVVIAQDEETSVVWGMPGAAAHANICSAILPLEKISDYMVKTANM